MADLDPDFDNNAHIIVAGVVSVGTTAVPLRIGASLSDNTEYIAFQNLGNATVTFGGPGLVAGQGFSLKKNQYAVQECVKGFPIYAIVASGTVDVYVAEKGC